MKLVKISLIGLLALLLSLPATASLRIGKINKSKNIAKVLISNNDIISPGDILSAGEDCEVKVKSLSNNNRAAIVSIDSCLNKTQLKLGKHLEVSSFSEDNFPPIKLTKKQSPTKSTTKENSDSQNQNYQQSRKKMAEYEAKTHVIKGFKLGFIVAPGIKIKFPDTTENVEMTSNSLTGISLGYAKVPFGTQQRFTKKIGFIFNLEILHATLSDRILYGSTDFNVLNLNANLTYTIIPKLFGIVGLNSPSFIFDEQLVGLDFDGRLGFQVGVGYEIYRDFSVQYLYTQNEYAILYNDTQIGELDHGMSRLELSYTF